MEKYKLWTGKTVPLYPVMFFNPCFILLNLKFSQPWPSTLPTSDIQSRVVRLKSSDVSGTTDKIFLSKHQFNFIGLHGVMSQKNRTLIFFCPFDRLCGLVVRVSGYRFRGPGFDSAAVPDFLRSKGSATGSTQPREDNWGATWMKN
jgi:hypothetical protein